MAVVETKLGCTLRFTPATRCLLAVLYVLAATLPIDALVLTSGTDGEHSGPSDPHHRGDALDIRTKNFPTRAAKYAFCDALQGALGDEFYCFVENPDSETEHIHVQVRKGHTYTPTAPAPGAPRNT